MQPFFQASSKSMKLNEILIEVLEFYVVSIYHCIILTLGRTENEIFLNLSQIRKPESLLRTLIRFYCWRFSSYFVSVTMRPLLKRKTLSFENYSLKISFGFAKISNIHCIGLGELSEGLV